jgi:hypothetical protein
MSARVFLGISWAIVLVMYVVGAVFLFLQPRDSAIPAPLNIVGGGALVMFAATLSFALAFASAARVSD